MINLFSYNDLKTVKQLFFELGLSYGQLGDLGKAIEYLNLALDEKDKHAPPENIEILTALGNSLLLNNENAEAVKIFLEATLVAPEHFSRILEESAGYLNPQTTSSLQKWIEETWKKEIEKMQLTGEQQGALKYFYANYYLFLGENERSKEIFTGLKEADPKNFRVLKGMGELYFQQNNFSEAINFFNDARKYAPENSNAFKEISISIIRSFLKTGDNIKASQIINDLERFEDIDKNQLYYYQSIVFSGLKEYGKSNEILDKLIIKDSRNIDYHLKRINNFIALHEYSKSLSLTEQAFQVDAVNNEVLFLKIQCLIEGVIDIEEGKRLFSGTKYSYLQPENETKCIKKIETILSERVGDGNAAFFAAYIYKLIDPESDKINGLITNAESTGLQNENTYPDLGLYLLKAEMAEKENDTVKVADQFFEAAKIFYWQGDYKKADNYFTKILTINPLLHEAGIYHADTLLILSYIPSPPYYDKNITEQAFKIWTEHYQIVEGSNDAWHYIVGARIHEVLFKFSNNFYDDQWKTLLYTERALVHDKSNISFLIYLGRFYCSIGMEQNSKEAFSAAADINNNDEFLKEEKIILQLNMGEFEYPEEYLKELKEKEKITPGIYKAVHKSWEGYLLFHKGEFEKADILLENVIKEENSNLFAWQLKMFCYWFDKKLEAAKFEAAEIIKIRNKYDFRKEEFTFAWAFFINGDVEAAIHLLEPFDTKAQTKAEKSFLLYSLSQFYLYNGQTEKANNSFNRFIKWVDNKRLLNEILTSYPVIRLMITENKPVPGTAVTECIELIFHLEKKIENKLKSLNANELTAEDELIRIKEEYQFEKGSLASIVILAAKARLTAEHNLVEAWRMYNELAVYNDLFPEAGVAITQIENEIFAPAINDIKDLKYNDSINLLNDLHLSPSTSEWRKDILLSLAIFGNNDEEKSLEHFAAAFKKIKEDIDLKKQFWAIITEHAYSKGLSWSFVSFIKNNISFADMGDSVVVEKDIIEDILNSLMNKETYYDPVLKEIEIYLHKDLIPVEAYGKDWYVVNKLIPALRETIFQKFGIIIPAITIKDNTNIQPDQYYISLAEVALVLGNVKKDKLFIPNPQINLEEAGIKGEAGFDPITLKNSLWVDEQYKGILDKYKVIYWKDYYTYVLAHLQTILEHNLDIFVNTQLCENYLSDFYNEKKPEEDNEIASVSQRIKDDNQLFIKFNQVIRALLKERVSVKDKKKIIDNFKKASENFSEVNDIIQLIRVGIKEDLPGNNIEADFFDLPGNVEEAMSKELVSENGKTFLAMMPENCQEALAAIREVVGKSNKAGQTVLLTKKPQLRIHLLKLVEIEFPYLIVMSSEELIA